MLCSVCSSNMLVTCGGGGRSAGSKFLTQCAAIHVQLITVMLGHPGTSATFIEFTMQAQ